MVCNKPESEFLTGQVECLQSCERLGSCLAVERLMIKSSTLFHRFECGPLPPTSTSRPPDVVCGKCFQAFFIFAMLQCIIDRVPKWAWLQILVTSWANSDDVT